MYKKTIIEFTRCNESQVGAIESMMRNNHPTLDGLSRAAFKKECKAAYSAVLWMNTPEGKAYVAELEKEMFS